MCRLNHTTDQRKRLGYVNPNVINQIELNPQINKNNLKYKNMRPKSKITVKKNSPLRKGLL
jgi:diketogulonate reductase-like aldo/keto reductase